MKTRLSVVVCLNAGNVIRHFSHLIITITGYGMILLMLDFKIGGTLILRKYKMAICAIFKSQLLFSFLEYLLSTAMLCYVMHAPICNTFLLY